MREVKKSEEQEPDSEIGKRRLTLTRLLIWAEQEASDLGRTDSALHINKAIGELFDKPK